MRARLTALLILLPLCAWIGYGFMGGRVASGLAARYGARLLAKGDGKFNDPRMFVQTGLKDAALLLTAACLVLLVYREIAALAARRAPAPGRWVVQGWCAFVCLNLFAAVAARTPLFWCVLYTGKDNIENYTQWHIKETLMSANPAPSQAILLGSSQTRAQIDAKALNDRLGRRIWTTELHFPGCCIYDTILCLERVSDPRVRYVIIYLSSPCFYTPKDDDHLMYFFGFRDLPTYWSLGPKRPSFDQHAVSGLLGDLFPLFRIWEPLMARLRPPKTQNAEQAAYDATLENNLADRAQRVAKGFEHVDSSFDKKAFGILADMCRRRGCRLILCCGQLNPILERSLNPSVRRDMVDFLHQQAAADTNIVLLDESQLPVQTESDYEDLTHVNLAARARFSQFMAGELAKLAQVPPELGRAH